MKNSSQSIAIGLTYVSFFAMIALAVYFTKSEYCLLALLFTPSATWSKDDKNQSSEND